MIELTAEQIAKKIGKSTETVRKFMKNNYIKPTRKLESRWRRRQFLYNFEEFEAKYKDRQGSIFKPFTPEFVRLDQWVLGIHRKKADIEIAKTKKTPRKNSAKTFGGEFVRLDQWALKIHTNEKPKSLRH